MDKAGGGGGAGKKPTISHPCHPLPIPAAVKSVTTRMKLGTIMPYLKNKDLNYIVDVIIRPKLFKSSISMRKVKIASVL